MSLIENEYKPTQLLNPVENLFNQILSKVSSHIYKSGIEPQIKKEERSISRSVFIFEGWEVEHKKFQSNPDNILFETELRTNEIGSWIKPNRITLSIYTDGSTKIHLKNRNNMSTNLSSKEISDKKALEDKLPQGAKEVLIAFPELDLVSLI